MLFVREVLGAEPDDKQQEVLRAVAAGERRISVRSGHGVGKTTALAWLVIWWICTRFPQKTVCTAPTSAQLFDALATEVRAWITHLTPVVQEFFVCKTDRIEHKYAPDESFVSFRTSRPETPEALAGVHSEHVLLIADEASGIPEQVFEAASGSMSGHSATTILTGNPVRTSGLFFDTHHKLKDNWRTIHISCVGHPRVTPDFIEDMKRRYGEDTNAYRVRVLGEFPEAEADTIIPFELMESALMRDVRPVNERPVWGLDCARFGQDRSALAQRRGNVLLEKVLHWKDLDTMELAGRVKALWDECRYEDRPTDVNVDAIGLGAGVADRLRELGLPARAINVSELPAMRERYLNLRAELWWTARDWFASRDVNLFNDQELGAELIAVRYKFTSAGKMQVESKADMKKRALKSPDLADAFILTFATAGATAAFGSKLLSWKEPLKRNIRGIV